jgi:hypothetical protein
MATDAHLPRRWRRGRAPRSMRSFDPRRLGAAECDGWVGYYRRRWLLFLGAAVRMVRVGFGMPWPHTFYGAWLVLRANQLWAPVPDNDPDGAQRTMRRFYALAARTSGEPFDVDEAARRELQWWRVHRHLQRPGPEDQARQDDQTALVDALTDLYAHVYGVAPEAVWPAAAERAAACRISDRWVADGCDPTSSALPAERAALVRSYAALLAAVHR